MRGSDILCRELLAAEVETDPDGSPLGTSLRKLLLDRFDVGEVEMLCICPDGELCRIPFAALPVSKVNNRLIYMVDTIAIHQFSCGRDIRLRTADPYAAIYGAATQKAVVVSSPSIKNSDSIVTSSRRPLHSSDTTVRVDSTQESEAEGLAISRLLAAGLGNLGTWA